MKKLIRTVSVVLALLAVGHVNMNAQTESKTDKYKVETNRFGNNWFMSIGGGVQTYFGDNSSEVGFGKRISPAVDFSVGKWFTPGLGLRLGYNGLSVKTVAFETNTFDTQKRDLMYLHGDVLFNLTDMFCGYKEDRVYAAIPYVGAGWLHTYDKPINNEFGASVGLINRFRLSSRWDFNIEARATMTKDEFDGVMGGKKCDGIVSVLAGFTFKFPSSSWNRAATRTVSTGISMEDMNRIQAQLREQQERARQLENDLVTERNKKPEVVVNKQLAVAPRIIAFPIGKSTISKEERVNIGYLAKAIKATDKSYTICGYADNATGSATTNDRLSKERAEAVRDLLVNEFGVPSSRLQVESKGGVANMFYDDAKLSRVVIVE